ncbi:hypothetical protein BHM03_00056443 [Ensete ventricosum]|nr:hypothetical protein BHM03_00056443 [Ensete ventricosum]
MGSDKWYRGVRTTKRAPNAEEEKGGSGRKKMRRWRKRKEQEKEAYRKLATPYGSAEEGRRGRSKKRENQENLDVNLFPTPFLYPDSTSPSLDDPDPGGNNEENRKERPRAVLARAASSRPVGHQRPRTVVARGEKDRGD